MGGYIDTIPEEEDALFDQRYYEINLINGILIDARMVERFWSKVDKNTCLGGVCGCHKGIGHCWPWTAAVTPQGYGSFSVGDHTIRLRVSSHCLAFVIQKTPISDGLFVCHICDNRPCARGDHLFQGTPIDNAQDMVRKGRHSSITHPECIPRGLDHPNRQKTHCPHGHAYTPDNVYIINHGQSRACKQCALDRARKQVERNRLTRMHDKDVAEADAPWLKGI
jgi:hypothetical protein